MRKIFEILARSKSVEVLLALRKKSLKFNEIVRVVGNATTTMRRVKELQKMSLISRKVLQDRKRSVEYSLTKKGTKVVEIIRDVERIS